MPASFNMSKKKKPFFIEKKGNNKNGRAMGKMVEGTMIHIP